MISATEYFAARRLLNTQSRQRFELLVFAMAVTCALLLGLCVSSLVWVSISHSVYQVVLLVTTLSFGLICWGWMDLSKQITEAWVTILLGESHTISITPNKSVAYLGSKPIRFEEPGFAISENGEVFLTGWFSSGDYPGRRFSFSQAKLTEVDFSLMQSIRYPEYNCEKEKLRIADTPECRVSFGWINRSSAIQLARYFSEMPRGFEGPLPGYFKRLTEFLEERKVSYRAYWLQAKESPLFAIRLVGSSIADGARELFTAIRLMEQCSWFMLPVGRAIFADYPADNAIWFTQPVQQILPSTVITQFDSIPSSFFICCPAEVTLHAPDPLTVADADADPTDQQIAA